MISIFILLVLSRQGLLFLPTMSPVSSERTASWNVSRINQLNSTASPIDVVCPIIRHHPQEAGTPTGARICKKCPVKEAVHPEEINKCSAKLETLYRKYSAGRM